MDVERIRASGMVRASGVAAGAVGVALGVLIAYGAWPFVVPGVAALAYGVRRYRIAAVADDAGVVVRNQFRTYRVPWASIVEMGFYERDVSAMQWSMSSRSSGLIYTREGRRFWIEATEATSIVMHGTRVSEPGFHGPSQLERLRRHWIRATEAAPSV
jgi:hypothetical protein